MSATNVSIRLGVEGKAEIKRAFEEVGQSGQAAFGSVEKALARSGAATDREVARLKRLAEAARMAGAADASQKRFNTVLNVDRPTRKSARDSASVFEEAARGKKIGGGAVGPSPVGGRHWPGGGHARRECGGF
jgi:hypothetical protein